MAPPKHQLATRTSSWTDAQQHGGTAGQRSRRQATSHTRPLACSSVGQAGPPHRGGPEVGRPLTEPGASIAATAAGAAACADPPLPPFASSRPASRRRPAQPAQAFLGLKMPFGSSASSASSAAAAKEEVRGHAAGAGTASLLTQLLRACPPAIPPLSCFWPRLHVRVQPNPHPPQLLEAIKPLKRGLGASEEEQARVDRLARALERRNPTKKPLASGGQRVCVFGD